MKIEKRFNNFTSTKTNNPFKCSISWVEIQLVFVHISEKPCMKQVSLTHFNWLFFNNLVLQLVIFFAINRTVSRSNKIGQTRHVE